MNMFACTHPYAGNKQKGHWPRRESKQRSVLLRRVRVSIGFATICFLVPSKCIYHYPTQKWGIMEGPLLLMAHDNTTVVKRQAEEMRRGAHAFARG